MSRKILDGFEVGQIPMGGMSGVWGTNLYNRILATRPTNLIAYYPLNDASGTVVADASRNTGNVITNGGFEIPGAGAPDLFANWVEIPGTAGTIADETTVTHSGGHAVKLTEGSSVGGTFVQHTFWASGNDPALQVGVTYTLKFWTRGDGTHDGNFYILDVTHSTPLSSYTNRTGVTGVIYTQVTKTFTVPAGCARIDIYFRVDSIQNAYVYYDDVELFAPVSARPLDGTLIGSGTTLTQPGISGLSMLFNGSGNVTLPPSLIHALTDGNKLINAGTVLCWNSFTESDVWTQADDRANDKQFWTIQAIAGVNEIYGYKCGGEYFVNLPIIHGGSVGNSQWHTNDLRSIGTGWASYVSRWNISGGTSVGFINGVQSGAMAGPDPAPTAWTAAPVTATIASFMSQRRNKAYMQHIAFWNVELTDAEIMNISRI